MNIQTRASTRLANQLFKQAQRFTNRPAFSAAIAAAALDPKRRAAAIEHPEGLLRRAGLKLPTGLAFDLFEHPPRSLPFPEWTPWVIELTNCRRIYRIECDEVQKVGEQRKCKLVEREFCLGWRIYPNPWPRGPYTL
jgi:hypothetical protein